jgi:toxin YhaV
MTKLICHGWEIFFHPELFGAQYQDLIDRVKKAQKMIATKFLPKWSHAANFPTM